jgi:hypothetical protein
MGRSSEKIFAEGCRYSWSVAGMLMAARARVKSDGADCGILQ